MSEFIAEAQVLVRPNTAAFRTQLLAELTAIQASIPALKIPILGADSARVTAGATAAAAAVTEETVAVSRLGAASVETAGAQRVLAASQADVSVASKNAVMKEKNWPGVAPSATTL